MAASRFRLGLVNHAKAKLLRHIFYDVWSHAVHLFSVSGDKGVFANCVNQTWKSSRMAVYGCNGLFREQPIHLGSRSRNLQAPFDVPASLDDVQRSKSRAKSNPLFKV